MPFASARAGAAGHVRQHLSLLAPSEKRVLVWLAGRLPRSVNSDHLSLLGLGSMVVAGLSLWGLGTRLAVPVVVLCLFANWFGDSLDGTLARVRDEQRPRYGYYVDHVIDLAGVTALLAGLATSDIMSPLVAMAVLAAYLLVSGESYLATHATGVFRISCAGVGPTELRIFLAIGLVKVTQSSEVAIAGAGTMRLFDVGGVIAAAALGLVFLTSAARNTRALYRAEPLRPGSQGGAT
jgi:phosphatidylglycerophosphate synthase